MKLNHLNLTVTDAGATADFLVKYFGLRNGGGNKNFILVNDDDGMVLTLMKGKDAVYPSTFHIGFIQPSEERVNEINSQLRADGFEVDPPSRSHAWTFYVRAPGGFMVEVLA